MESSVFIFPEKGPPAECGLILHRAATLNISSKLAGLPRAWGTEDQENSNSTQRPLILLKLCVVACAKLQKVILASHKPAPLPPGRYLIIKSTDFKTDWATVGKRLDFSEIPVSRENKRHLLVSPKRVTSFFLLCDQILDKEQRVGRI